MRSAATGPTTAPSSSAGGVPTATWTWRGTTIHLGHPEQSEDPMTWSPPLNSLRPESSAEIASPHSQPRALRHTTVRHHRNRPVRRADAAQFYTIYANVSLGSALSSRPALPPRLRHSPCCELRRRVWAPPSSGRASAPPCSVRSCFAPSSRPGPSGRSRTCRSGRARLCRRGSTSRPSSGQKTFCRGHGRRPGTSARACAARDSAGAGSPS